MPNTALSQIVLRATVLVAVVVATLATSVAGDAHLALGAGAIVFGAVSAAYPDTHVGLGVVLLIAVHWLVAVDDVTTPWVIPAGAAVALFHLSLAASSVGPISASWTTAMTRRWRYRTFVLVCVGAPVWAVTAIIEGQELPSNTVAFAAALMLVAGATLWARDRAPAE